MRLAETLTTVSSSCAHFSVTGAESKGAATSSLEAVKKLFQSHVDSFNYLIETGLSGIVECSKRQHVLATSETPSVEFWLEDLKVDSVKSKLSRVHNAAFKTPRACREAGETYRTLLSVAFCWKIGGKDAQRRIVHLGQLPIMVMSSACSLNQLSTAELLARGEESNEAGGYFIINGIERMIRMIIQQRRHHILGLRRRAFTKRSPLFSEFATTIRCISKDESSSLVRLHYMRNGMLRVAFQYRRQEFFVPAGIIMRALVACSDAETYTRVCVELLSTNSFEETFVKERLAILQQECHALRIHNQVDALAYLGAHFRASLEASSDENDIAVGERFLENFILIHLEHHGDKFSLLILMMNKLFALVTGHCGPDDPDSLVNQEVLLPGLLVQSMIREKVHIAFQKAVSRVRRLNSRIDEGIAQIVDEAASTDIGKAIEYFLATGNLVSPSGLGLSQTSGFTIVAEKLNYFRYLSHFRSVHRGAYFMELRTTTVRKLLPESWGFLCPVHTPDGSPCGLLNHLAEMCEVVVPGNDSQLSKKRLQHMKSLFEWALVDAERREGMDSVPVVIEGVFLGYIGTTRIKEVVESLRIEKSNSCSDLRMVEICHIPLSSDHGLFPGLYIFHGPSRLMRPVRQLNSGKLEFIGTLEQAFLAIDSRQANGNKGECRTFTHKELSNTSPLSCIASLTPWSDFNQSPRNMYQCQMAKQTMGTAMHSICFRSDTKLYRLHTPQRPIAMTCAYDKYSLDDYALGTNAVVAVLAYTGYDMEDAMILNRASVSRGFSHATLYKTVVESVSRHDNIGLSTLQECRNNQLDRFGTAQIGSTVEPGSTLLRVCSVNGTSKVRHIRIHGTDPAIVDRVVLTSSTNKGNQIDKRAAVTLRYNRNPVIGDKFSSRHGQKGVLSFLWPEEDMPFCERTGIRPDVIINPHAFPSRMTIGMLVESLAAKACAAAGTFADATPFTRDPSNRSPAARYGELLRDHGYNYCGNERLVNGCTGDIFSVDIFIGVVYYQRLRHMVLSFVLSIKQFF